jgi:hypothetical protein
MIIPHVFVANFTIITWGQIRLRPYMHQSHNDIATHRYNTVTNLIDQ